MNLNEFGGKEVFLWSEKLDAGKNKGVLISSTPTIAREATARRFIPDWCFNNEVSINQRSLRFRVEIRRPSEFCCKYNSSFLQKNSFALRGIFYYQEFENYRIIYA